MVKVGDVALGGQCPVLIQTMANTSTMDTAACVAQVQELVTIGAKLVRFAAQGVREAANLCAIRQALNELGVQVSLSADIHYTPAAAFEAVKHVDKVRINPGNFVKMPLGLSLGEDEDEVRLRIEEVFVPLLDLCKEHGVALRIGVNHGSLSQRIIERYGDTVEGMIASCMEFLRICVAHDFGQVVISMKSSNTKVMVEAVEGLIVAMEKEAMSYPLHLGVTEAGEGEDGRIKSAVGLGALLTMGIGDTIRVSLSEEPKEEIPVAQYIVDYVSAVRAEAPGFDVSDMLAVGARSAVSDVQGGRCGEPVVVGLSADYKGDDRIPDYIYCGADLNRAKDGFYNLLNHDICPEGERYIPLYKKESVEQGNRNSQGRRFLALEADEVTADLLQCLDSSLPWVLLVESKAMHVESEVRKMEYVLQDFPFPVVLHRHYTSESAEELALAAAIDYGRLFLKGYLNGLFLSHDNIAADVLVDIAFGILQAARVRISKTEYVSCPGCGRTNFSLHQVVSEVKRATSHLKGLKIGVMGCIVNGPGEMADADYGYVGSASGKVCLYKKQECVERNIPEKDAVQRLIALIKEYGDWVEP